MPAKKQSKWSPDEDALIIELRGRGMKWEDISKRLPGRSAISCRLHYQNYLERRSEWDEDRKNKLARLYERFKPEMWAKVAEEMAVPWRAAEAMHWQLGEAEMARRAGVVPFSLSSVNVDSANGRRGAHSSPSSPSGSGGGGGTTSRFRAASSSHSGGGRALPTARDSTPRSVPPPMTTDGLALAAIGGPLSMGRGASILPSVAEMTTGVSPYTSPAYSMSVLSPASSASSFPSPELMISTSAATSSYLPQPSHHKRRAISPTDPRETSRRRL